MTGARPFASALPLSLSIGTVLVRALARLAETPGAPEFNPALAEVLVRAVEMPSSEEARIAGPARALGLDPAEVLCLYLLWRTETDPAIAREVAARQTGEARHRPSVALLADLVAMLTPGTDARALLEGPLFALPLARALADGTAPLSLAPTALTEPMLGALGLPSRVRLRAEAPAEGIPAAYRISAAALAAHLAGRRVALVLRGALPADQRLFAAALAEAKGAPLLPLDDIGAGADTAGLTAALRFAPGVPVEAPKAAAGSRAPLLDLGGHPGPRIVLLGGEGGIEAPGWDIVDAALPTLSGADRAAAWARVTATPEAVLPIEGLGPSRIAAVAARMAFAHEGHPPASAFRRAAGEEARPDLEPHARLVAAEVDDTALVAPPALAAELGLLLARCRQRRDRRATLGPAFHARGCETGVRALLAGPSGAGKTLACAWLATRLGLPLFRVDLASVVSKYIGETEENLARILDRAEAADVLLLFDEADSLFGARTEVKDSSDRFANNQTNFLLTRIESYGGIVLLTTNGRQRIDAAFSRRIDQVIDVPVPDAKARRAIWRAHLGMAHALAPEELNRLAHAADIAGGHIRSAVLGAAVMAAEAGTPIGMEEVARALALEYRKIGRAPPSELVRP